MELTHQILRYRGNVDSFSMASTLLNMSRVYAKSIMEYQQSYNWCLSLVGRLERKYSRGLASKSVPLGFTADEIRSKLE